MYSEHSVAGEPFPRTGVLPDTITSEDLVIIGIANLLSPCVGTSDSYPTFYHLSETNHITFVFAGLGVNPCPDIPGFGLQYETMQLMAGDYTLQVYVVGGPNSIPVTINDPLGTEFGDLIQFSVQGSKLEEVPALGKCALIAVIFLFILIQRFTFKSIVGWALSIKKH